MIIARDMLCEFVAFVRATFGIQLCLYDEKRGDEYGRFMFRDSLVVIRDVATDVSDANTLEVLCFNKDHMEEMAGLWAVVLRNLMGLQDGVMCHADEQADTPGR